MLEHTPEPESGAEEDDPWQWASFTKLKKRNKAKKGAIDVSEIVHEVEDQSTVTVEPADGNPELGACDVDATSEPLALAKDNVNLWPLKSTEESNGNSDLEAKQPTKAEGEICPLRVKHLLDGDKWKHCRQCWAIVC